MKTAIRIAACTLLLAVINCGDGYARPCDPTDPLGAIKTTYALTYNASINDNTFTTGVGLPITTIHNAAPGRNRASNPLASGRM